LAEYSNIILMSFLIVIFFFGGWLPLGNINIFFFLPKELWIIIKVLFLIYMFILVRGTMPRYRYDQLMMLGWKIFLPLSLGYLIFFIVLLLLFF
jgi:NADH-quinone oxidoreductase subunit H